MQELNDKYLFVYLLRNLASSSWSTENVRTVTVTGKENNSFDVTCESSHLTSFSVLVEVTDIPGPVSCPCLATGSGVASLTLPCRMIQFYRTSRTLAWEYQFSASSSQLCF